MKNQDFIVRRRQIYLDEESYRNTVAQLEAESSVPVAPGLNQEDICGNLKAISFDKWLIAKRGFANATPNRIQ